MTRIQDIKKFYAEIGENIKQHRVQAGYSQEEVAKFLDLTRTSIVNVEKGRQHPPLNIIYDLATLLKVQVNDLLPQDDKRKQDKLIHTAKQKIDVLEQKFKDVPIYKDKLIHFFQISS